MHSQAVHKGVSRKQIEKRLKYQYWERMKQLHHDKIFHIKASNLLDTNKCLGCFAKTEWAIYTFL